MAFAIATTFVYGQNYKITPNDTITATAPFSALNHFTIQQNNLIKGTLVFSWQQILLDIPKGWTANLCDNGHCYPAFPTGGTMDTVFKGDYGLMSIGIFPDTISGTAVVRYAVWESNTPKHLDTLTWIISANETTGTFKTKKNNDFSIYPNVANNNINIFTNLSAGFQFLICDANGKQIEKGNSTSNEIFISTANFSNGNYTISIIDLNHNIYTKQLIIQHK